MNPKKNEGECKSERKVAAFIWPLAGKKMKNPLQSRKLSLEYQLIS